MKKLFRRIIILSTKSSVVINDKLPGFLSCINTAAESPHTAAMEEDEEKAVARITTICKSFSNNLNWEILNGSLKSFDVRSPSIINRVLIQLKDTPNAKKALSFFHWSSHFSNITHQIDTYALVIHILINAKLIRDASALIESVLVQSVAGNCKDHSGSETPNDAISTQIGGCDVKGNGSFPVLSVVQSLMNSYEVTGSSPFVFDLSIQICSKLRMIDDAIDICFYLGEQGFRLSVISYNTLLHVIQKSDKSKMVWRVYEHMIEHRTSPNEKTVGIMISALCKEGKLQNFVNMIDRISGKRCLPPVIVNTCLVYGIIEEGRIEDGLNLLKRISLKNMIIDSISYSLTVYGKLKLKQLESAWEVYEEMLKRGFKVNSFLHTSFIGAYCEAGMVDKGYELFEEMENLGLKPYDETYTHMMVGCSKAERLNESFKFCEKMVQNGFIPSCLVFNEVVERLNGHRSVRWADEMLTRLLDKGFMPDVNTYSHLVAGYGRLGDVEGVIKLYYEMEYRKLSPDASVFSWLIVGLCKAGRLEESEKFLSTMKARSLHRPTSELDENNIKTTISDDNETHSPDST